MRWRTRTAVIASGVGVSAVALMAWAGVAAAVSGGGYQPGQQDCSRNSSAWSTAPGTTEFGCHNVAVNVESGGQTQGDPNSNNTRYFEFGGNQLPITNEPATPTVLGLGYPGQQNSEHAGCIAFDTNGTGGGTGTGCGTGTGGLGFEINYDYYNLIQPGYTDMGGFPVPSPTGTKVGGGVPFTFTPDTNVAGIAGPGSVFNTFLTQGLQVYFGQDDNTDAGEHDGVSGVEGQCPQPNPDNAVCHSAGTVNGPSDGGGMLLSIEPQWLLVRTDAGSASHPEGFVNYSEGFCADGICSGFTTQQQKVYNGCVTGNGGNPHDECSDTNPPATNDNVYRNNTPASTSESGNCSSGSANEESCGNTGLDQYRQNTPTNMYTEPGLQTYQDPDPQRSPALPFGTPGTYVGTCGLYLNDSGGAGSPGITGQDPGYVVQNPTDPACGY